MSMDRRQFLKIAGISSILGLGATAASATHNIWVKGLSPEQAAKNPEALNAQHWAMVVDMSKFKTDEDFQKTISACHLTHNVPDFKNPDGSVDLKDEIKWIWKEKYENAFPDQDNPYMDDKLKEMPFVVLCNHCENPACVRVCPTQATFKRKQDGIVMMDMHRCIGCRFCMAGCPFSARSFNWRDPRPYIGQVYQEFPTREIGVVEKCNFCAERLERGLIPACVEASNGAMAFGDLTDSKSKVRELLRTNFTIRRKAYLGTNPQVYYIVV